MKITLIGVSFVFTVISASVSASAQQQNSAPGHPQDWPSTGLFKSAQGGIFRIDSIDPDGSLRGVHTGVDDHGVQKPWDTFVAKVGEDGYPEYTVAGGSNKYLHMHACGANVCTIFYQSSWGTKAPILLQRQ